MNQTLIQIQVFYEIATVIGKSPYLGQMVRESLSAYLRKLCCSTGMVLQAVKEEEDITSFNLIVTIPYKAHSSPTMKALINNIPSRLDPLELDHFHQSLPLTIQMDERKYCYIMHLPGYGLLVLIKSGDPFPETLLKSLVRLNNKFADACLVCLHHEETARFNDQLMREIEERQHAEEALRQVLDELEIRVAERTHELVLTNHRLEEALANVKILSGLLPICAECKKIRDDRGYWNQIETYISQHTEAVFTHGLCPDCARKLFGDLIDCEL